MAADQAGILVPSTSFHCWIRSRASPVPKTWRSGRSSSAAAPRSPSQASSASANGAAAGVSRSIRRTASPPPGSPRPDQRRVEPEQVVEAVAVGDRLRQQRSGPRGRRQQPARQVGIGHRYILFARRLAREHAGVARGGGGGIEQADDAAHGDRGLDDRARVRLALVLVAVEDVGARVATDDGGELPREVGGVADARAHALPGERRHLMRRVARKQNAPVPPAAGDERVEVVHRGPLEPHVVNVAPRREQGAQAGVARQLGRRLARPHHELPAETTIGHRPCA